MQPFESTGTESTKLESTKIESTDKKVYISTYGCQMNVNDTERMYALLEMSNFIPVSSPEQANLILINACSVREKPVHKVYSEVGKYRTLKNKNPNLKIGVGGCVGQQEKGELLNRTSLIDFVFGTDTIDQLPSLVAKAFEGETKFIETRFEHKAPYHIETLIRNPGVSTFINVTKGCDNFCTFCVVPYTRGREKSRPLKHVLEDVQNLIKRGVKEVTFLGQNVNSYKSECGADFADMLERVAQETDIQRLRFTTSHPKDFNQKLANVMLKNKSKICEYIHLPVQSGNSRVLQEMNRNYTREEYLEKVNMIREIMPKVVFSSDIIVGFPGETENEFMDTLSLVEEVGFETIFAFKYSPRPFTKAARFENQISEDVKSDRLAKLLEVHDKMAMELVKKYEGRVLDVLVEQFDKEQNLLSGRTSQNKLVYFNLIRSDAELCLSDSNLAGTGKSDFSESNLVGKTVPVKVVKAFPATFRGEMVI